AVTYNDSAREVNLNFSGSAANLRWNSTSSSTWDAGVTSNWFNLGTSAVDAFFFADNVLFSDLANVQTNVALSGALFPTSITNNSSTNYFLTGSGKISGGSGIVKSGTGILTVSTTNDFNGAVLVQAGTFRVGTITG